ncbi:MAG: DUF2066 domain-containing protein [Xanthomonadaceae bacterium]|nr:DUF2066 domain-containing protein [Xanthomonadaceae bacterium]
MRRSLGFILWTLCLMALPVWAQSELRTEGETASATGAYEAEVPVDNQTPDARNNGFSRAMAIVLSKLSGNSDVMAQPGVAQEVRRAADYVEGYDYRQDQGTSASGAAAFNTILVARFRGRDIDAIAETLGLQVWPQPRPKPVVWLAIDDGSGGGPRLVGLQQSNAARPLLDNAIARGFRLGLPAGNAAEQALVGAIWRKDTAAVARASSRYSPPMQLLGKLYRSGNGWAVDWTFIDNGRVLANSSNSGGDARQLLAGGADVAADALIKRYARTTASEPAGTYRLVFTNLRSAGDYLLLSSTLQRMSVVRRIVPVRADGERLEVDLDLLTGISGFNRMLASESRIVAVEGAEAEYQIR